MPPAGPNVVRTFLMIGVLGGLALVTAVLLWLTEVITMPVFLAAVVVVALAELAAVIILQRRASRRQATTHEQATRGTVSTLDEDGPSYGYDPMAGRDPWTGRDLTAGQNPSTGPVPGQGTEPRS